MMYVVKLQFKFEKIQALRIDMEFIDKQRLSSVYKHIYIFFISENYTIFWNFSVKAGLNVPLPDAAAAANGVL